MADLNHLERMGGELKCPICLSLLNSSVSLACNHVFCNSCIMKSMKSDSNCPVCKVPYRRREVRPAPHMDSLVSIYKNMEAASGINIFVTQNPQFTVVSESENKGEKGDGNVEGGSSMDVGLNKRSKRGRPPKKTKASYRENSFPVSVKPSCPTKKRVQVPLYQSTKMPTSHANHDTVLREMNGDILNNTSIAPKEKPQVNKNDELVFRPFFWLREEEDADKSSQNSENYQLTDTPTPIAPAFSDIKDSDDEMPSPSTKEYDGKPTALEIYDSEMFEWTQRPCSPELCPSPLKVQDLSDKEMEFEVSPDDAILAEETNSGNAKVLNKTKKRVRNAREKIQKKSVKTKSHSSRKKVPETGNQDEIDRASGGTSTVKRVSRSRSKKGGSPITLTEPKASGNVCGGTSNDLFETCDTLFVHLGDAEDTASKKPGKVSKVRFSLQKDSLAPSKKRKTDDTEDAAVLEDFNNPNQNRNHEVSCLSFPTTSLVDQVRPSILRRRGSSEGRIMKLQDGQRFNEELNIGKNRKSSSGALLEVPSNASARAANARELEDSTGAGQSHQSTAGPVLQKCRNIAGDIKCAFCHSSECSEESGEMVHYCDGMPVSMDHGVGSRVIHSHKNCVEWAPNVYFEDDKAVNLEAELARSRRIKCCLCGIKGASLGCFEKSCRKSFHVPCAKLTPQCRWDLVNFVMLCPLHASSKLPIEMPGSLETTRKRSNLKERPRKSSAQVEKKQETSTVRSQNQTVPRDKMVLCCSTLTTEERDLVSKFERSFKVTVLQKWDSRVTHVIASTDENGACKRTLKVLMAILEGKWILSVNWIRACIDAMELVEEEKYEIVVDVHGMRDGPRLGRTRALNMQPKLLEGLKFYFMGDFAPSYKGYLQDLVIAAGGTTLHRKPVPGGGDDKAGSSSTSFVIYNLETSSDNKLEASKKLSTKRKSDAEALAGSTGSKAVSNSWLLDSIAACKLQG